MQEEFVFDALEARKVMYQILKDDEARDTDKINVAKDFLDRAGFKPTDKAEININADETTKKLDAILEQLEE